jgi:hypothetical protein
MLALVAHVQEQCVCVCADKFSAEPGSLRRNVTIYTEELENIFEETIVKLTNDAIRSKI